jgi:hypothetical protein
MAKVSWEIRGPDEPGKKPDRNQVGQLLSKHYGDMGSVVVAQEFTGGLSDSRIFVVKIGTEDEIITRTDIGHDSGEARIEFVIEAIKSEIAKT